MFNIIAKMIILNIIFNFKLLQYGPQASNNIPHLVYPSPTLRR
jgi:hypothetical protein